MTFTDKPPTTPGFYAWRSTKSSTQPIARYLCELQFYVGLRCAQSGMAPAQIGGLWCRLVPADEVEKAWQECARIIAPGPIEWDESRARSVATGEEQ